MLKRIRAFVAVVESGSFTAAAERLGIAQPAVSRYIRQLEDAAGARLIDRQKHQLKMTEAGAQLFAAAQPMMQHADRVESLIRHLGRHSNLSTKLGSDFFSGHVRARNRIVDAFIERFPSFDLSVAHDGSEELLAMLRAGEIDLAFMPLPGPDDSFEALEIATIQYAILAPAGFWPERRLCAEQLRGLRLLFAEENAHPALLAHIKAHLTEYEIAWVHPSETEMASRARMVKATGIPTLWLDGDAAEPNIKLISGLEVYQLPVTFYFRLGLVRRRGDHKHGDALFWKLAEDLTREDPIAPGELPA
jgi:DNA-binding transcriptional LysR family regulator